MSRPIGDSTSAGGEDSVVEDVRAWLAERGLPATPNHVGCALRSVSAVRSSAAGLATVASVEAELSGAGALQPLLADPAVTDVLVHAGGDVWVDRGGGLERSEVRLRDEAAVRALAIRLVATAGRRLDAGQPFADAVLPEGHRVHAVLSPIAVDGTCVSLRALRPGRHNLAGLAAGMVTGTERWIRAVVDNGVAAVISGATGVGKTTLLSAMLGELASALRVVIVEDTAELRPVHPQVVRLQARAANVEGAGEIGLQQLVRQALRMRPDRLVLGEVRGAEVIDLLVALNTGHAGGLCTLHANDAVEVPARVEALAALGGVPREAAHSLLAPALRVVLHLVRTPQGRRLDQIGVLEAAPNGLVRCVPALRAVSSALVAGPAYPALVDLLGEHAP
jgi:pilus assembly protein CpaF